MTKVIYNGRICLPGKKFCEALMLDKGRIIKTGSSRDLLEEAPGNAEKTDAGGALILPAFHDSHLHLMWIGRREGGIECAGAKSVTEVISRGRETIARLKPAPGSYIQGAGVNPDLFCEGEKRDLRREDVDKISTEYPILLSRHCGHTIYCNSLALKFAGLSESAPEVEGGTIEKDESGKPTGVLRENANVLVRKPMPAYTREDIKGFLRLAMKKAHSLGISSCGSYDSGGPDFENVLAAYKSLYDESREAGVPCLRVTMQCGVSAREDMLDAHLYRRIPSGAILWEDPYRGIFLKMGAIKLFADGTLGGHTAWMRQPYRDKAETCSPAETHSPAEGKPGPDMLRCGFPVLDQTALDRFVQKSAAGARQVLIHAIGDAGIDSSLKAFEKVTGPGKNPLRHGIIHCQITTPDLFERMARNGILALVQPIFLADDLPIIESRVGPRLASTSYAWNTLHKLGIPVSYSSDAPVSKPDPLLNIEWAVLRRDSENPSSASFYPNEKVDIHTAVDAYTSSSVFSNFADDTLGRLEPGRYADLVFLDRDIFTIPPEEIHKARVLRTMCAGETVYSV